MQIFFLTDFVSLIISGKGTSDISLSRVLQSKQTAKQIVFQLSFLSAGGAQNLNNSVKMLAREGYT